MTAGFGSMGEDGGSTSRSVLGICHDYVAVGDADGSVRLLQLDMGDSVSVAQQHSMAWKLAAAARLS